MTQMVRVLIVGTTVTPLTANVIYRIPRAVIPGLIVVSPPWGGLGPVPQNYQALRPVLDDLVQGRPCCLYGHSQGGLDAVEYAYERPNVATVVAVNAPFAGSNLAYLGRAGKGISRRLMPVLRDFEPGSSYLQGLAGRLEVVKSRLVCAWSPFDGAVFPGTSARVAGAHQNLKLPPYDNHYSELLDKALWRYLGTIGSLASPGLSGPLVPQQRSPVQLSAHSA